MQQELVQLHDSVKYNAKMYRLAQGLSFADAYDQLGPHCKEVWEKQGHLNTTAMLFLMSMINVACCKASCNKCKQHLKLSSGQPTLFLPIGWIL